MSPEQDQPHMTENFDACDDNDELSSIGDVSGSVRFSTNEKKRQGAAILDHIDSEDSSIRLADDCADSVGDELQDDC